MAHFIRKITDGRLSATKDVNPFGKLVGKTEEHSKDVKFPDKALARVEKLGDLFEPVEQLKQELP
jgi:hypothetical protein